MPSEPLISIRSAFLRPVAKRLASYVASAPSASRATKTAASSTVTGPVSGPGPSAAPLPAACAARPLYSAGNGRCLTNVSVIALTPVIRWPVTYWVMSMMCAPMSPSAPEPALSLCNRQTSGNCGSTIQSWRYAARTWRMVPSLPSAIICRIRVTAGTRR